MFVINQRVTLCCFCIGLRIATYIIGCLNMAGGILNTIRSVVVDDSNLIKFLHIVLNLMTIFISVILLVGVLTGNVRYIHKYVITKIICIVVAASVFLCFALSFIFDGEGIAGLKLLIFVILMICIESYFVIVVNSYKMQLEGETVDENISNPNAADPLNSGYHDKQTLCQENTIADQDLKQNY